MARIKKHSLIILVAILILGFILRVDKLYTWPRTGATFDEYAWTWLGISLINDHYPQSWSPHVFYANRNPVIYQKTSFVLVKPYLEHPPLFGLIAGSYAKLSGVRDFYQVDVRHIRGLAVGLGVLSIFFLYLLVKELYDTQTALIAASLYATIPTIAVGSRLVQNENFFIPGFLLSLFLIKRYIRTGHGYLRNIAAIICGLLTLAKVPWIALQEELYLYLCI